MEKIRRPFPGRRGVGNMKITGGIVRAAARGIAGNDWPPRSVLFDSATDWAAGAWGGAACEF